MLFQDGRERSSGQRTAQQPGFTHNPFVTFPFITPIIPPGLVHPLVMKNARFQSRFHRLARRNAAPKLFPGDSFSKCARQAVMPVPARVQRHGQLAQGSVQGILVRTRQPVPVSDGIIQHSPDQIPLPEDIYSSAARGIEISVQVAASQDVL